MYTYPIQHDDALVAGVQTTGCFAELERQPEIPHHGLAVPVQQHVLVPRNLALVDEECAAPEALPGRPPAAKAAAALRQDLAALSFSTSPETHLPVQGSLAERPWP